MPLFEPFFQSNSFFGYFLSLILLFIFDNSDCCLFFTLCGAEVMSLFRGVGRSFARCSIFSISRSAFLVASQACKDGVVVDGGVVKIVMISVAV